MVSTVKLLHTENINNFAAKLGKSEKQLCADYNQL